MFDKVLIANRGAIATRIIRTLNELNVRSVAVYAECDANSLHVQQANEAYSLGEGGAATTYLDAEKLLEIAKKCGAEAIHPGYGFLSENADFVNACESAGIAFIGPTAEQITRFGLKHHARALANKANTPLLPGSELLDDVNDACREALRIGYPVMLKSTAGGGGIGMQLCHSEAEIREAFERVKRLGANNFANDGVFLEKFIVNARHIEVQVFGDGQGQTLAIGERDCSSQRRNQKVVEECPAPGLETGLRNQLHDTAERLVSLVNYRNAGTVEFILDADTQLFYFLEVNTRLQVEHGVTEQVYGIDLVEWMIRQAAGEMPDLATLRPQIKPHGHAIQTRLYAEDPYKNFQPSAGLLSEVYFPQLYGVRIDHWIESGIEIPVYFDPMLAKVIVHAEHRQAALTKLRETLEKTRLYGVQTNLDYLIAFTRDKALIQGKVTTRYLNQFDYIPARIDVLQGGTLTTIQDYPARTGYWHIGVPPSGPFDSLSFRLGNRLLENTDDSAALEITLQGPTLKFSQATQVALTGADIEATLDGIPVSMWQVITIESGQTLKLGRVTDAGVRTYLAVRGGLDCPEYLGSRSTFTLGQFGGHNGRALRTGDVLSLLAPSALAVKAASLEPAHRPEINSQWVLNVVYGPHGAPDFFTQKDIDTFFSSDWEVHYNSSRTGIRLIGPKPEWARRDGGEAGLHPSNIHDNAYAFGTVDFTGDMPVILGPDGPSLGGFVCPATVIQADLWKLGQLRAGDRVRFRPVSHNTAVSAEKYLLTAIASNSAKPVSNLPETAPQSPVVGRFEADKFGDAITYRLAGDHFLLVEYGEQTLDIRLRFRVHALMQWLEKHPVSGIKELTPGIRSLQVHFDSQRLSLSELLAHLEQAEMALSDSLDEMRVPSRVIHLPLAWDDDACQIAIQKYMQSVRKDAPWCPSNLEFIRRINGLPDIDAVKEIVYNASYLVMGLGDVYLGAPVATPLDPRHRLVTTKYNPARTWTAENSVGIGGSYLCIYGMEGPGGYQFVGRTLQMWNRYKTTTEFEMPWLLRFFDQIRFYEVSSEELINIRRDFPQGRYPLKIEQTEFGLSDYTQFLQQHEEAINQFVTQRNAAFEQELAHWHASGQFNFSSNEDNRKQQTEQVWPEGSTVLDSPVPGSVWKILVREGDQVETGDTLLILESMKMEISIDAPQDGVVHRLLLGENDQVNAGQALIVLE